MVYRSTYSDLQWAYVRVHMRMCVRASCRYIYTRMHKFYNIPIMGICLVSGHVYLCISTHKHTKAEARDRGRAQQLRVPTMTSAVVFPVTCSRIPS